MNFIEFGDKEPKFLVNLDRIIYIEWVNSLNATRYCINMEFADGENTNAVSESNMTKEQFEARWEFIKQRVLLPASAFKGGFIVNMDKTVLNK